MATSVPREVLQRALRNQPQPNQKGPKFGTFAWRAQSITSSGNITTVEPTNEEPANNQLNLALIAQLQ
jgi:hypothetical protein